MPDEQQIGDPIDTLYKVVVDKGLYTKSLDEFKSKYSSPEEIGKLYQVVKDQGLYSKSADDFNQKYFSSVKKNGSSVSFPKIGDIAPPKQASESTSAPAVKIPITDKVPIEQKLAEKHQAAQQLLHQELNSNADIIPKLVTKLKTQAKYAQDLTAFAEKPRTDQPLTQPQMLANSLKPQEAPVSASPEDVDAFLQTAQTDPSAGRAFLSHIATEKPDKSKSIQSALYTVDAMDRLSNDPNANQKAVKVIKNVQGIESGKLEYSPITGHLQKPEDPWESIATGIKHKEQAFADYDLFNNSTPEKAIAELEKRRAEYDPDEATPVPKGFGAEMTSGMASQPIRGLVAGKVVGGATAMVPGIEEFAPAVDKFVAAAASGDDYRKMSYANYLQQNYNDLRNKGVTEDLAYAQAQDAAKKQSMVDAVGGAAMMYAGGAISKIKLPAFNMSEGFTKAVVNGLKQGAKGIGEAGAVGLIQGAGQDMKNKIAQQSGITTDESGKDIGEAMKSGALFTLGMAVIAKGAEMVSAKTKTRILNGLVKATPEQVNAELGTQVMEGHITPTEAQAAAKTIEEHRVLDESIPPNITPENRMKILDKIDSRKELEDKLEKSDKAYHPEIKEKIKAINEDILELSKEKLPRGEKDVLDVPQEEENAPRGTQDIENKPLAAGDQVVSDHFEGSQTIRSISPDGKSVFIEGEQDHHVHEVPVDEVRKPETNIVNPQTEDNASPVRSDTGQVQEGGDVNEGSENPRGQDLQQPEGQTPVNGQTQQQEGQQVNSESELGQNAEPPPPIEQPVLTGNSGDENLVGPSHAALKQAADRLGLKHPLPGEMYTPEEYSKRGREMINAGVDPVAVGEQFKKDKQVSPDVISVARAHLEDLHKAANKAGDDFGLKSPEYKTAKEAIQKWQDEVMKPMGNIAGQTFTSLQGQRNVDTGSFTSISRAAEEAKGKPLSELETKTAQSHAEEVQKLKDKITDLQDKIDKNFSGKETPETKKFTQKAKSAADTFRKLKTKEFTFKDSNGNDVPIQKMGVGWNELVELGAKAIEKTGEIADGVAAIIGKVKEADWYKGLSDKDKDRFENELTDHYAQIADKKTASRIKALEKELSDLQEGKVKEKSATRKETEREKELKEQIEDAKEKLGLKKPKRTVDSDQTDKNVSDEEKVQKKKEDLIKSLADKKDNKFTPEEAKGIWEYMRDTYLHQNGALYEDALANTAKDLGLSAEQVRHAITSPKGNRAITDEMYNTMYKNRMAQRKAENWIKGQAKSGSSKFFGSIPAFFFGLKTFGHGTVGMITHSGINIFRPSAWKTYWPNFIRQFKFFFGKAADYERFMQDFVRDKDFTFWKRAGLAVDPNQSYEEYQGNKNFFGRMGERSERGFNVLKVYRLAQAKEIYSHLSDIEKADPETAKEIAKIVNHSTGTSEVNFGKLAPVVSTAFFAPKMEVARWQRLIQQPTKAIGTLINWKDASPSDKVAAKLISKRSGEVIATWLVGLAANQALLSLGGAKQSINFIDPTKSDWLKFKAGERNIDFSGGMQSTMRFVGSILDQMFNAWSGGSQRTTPKDKIESAFAQYIRGKSSPFAGTIWEALTGADAVGRPLPFSSVKPKKGEEPYGFWEYAFSGQGPIPLSEALKDIHDSMKEKGLSDPDIQAILWGIGTGVVSGGTGARMTQDRSIQHEGGDTGGSGAGGNYEIKEWK